MVNRSPGERRLVVVGVGDDLGRSPGRAKENRIRCADGDRRPLNIRLTRSASPHVIAFHVRENLEGPTCLLLCSYRRTSIDVSWRRIRKPAARWKIAKGVVM